jgi:hypothetical protein
VAGSKRLVKNATTSRIQTAHALYTTDRKGQLGSVRYKHEHR